MATRFVDQLKLARQRLFVGRQAEKKLFELALTASEPPFYVLYLFGPAGVGKTSLLREFITVTEQHQIKAIYLDAHHIDPSPIGFMTALALAMGQSPQDFVLDDHLPPEQRTVILLDTAENLRLLDTWLWDIFLSNLPAQTFFVMAGRDPLPLKRLSDPGWQEIVRSVPLRNLTNDERHQYLTKRNIPTTQHQTILSFTHGHPFALSLVADLVRQRPDWQLGPEVPPDIVKTLLDRFIAEVPSDTHRQALEACALVRVLNEALLAEMLALPNAHDMFNWLRELSFIDVETEGIFPHDLARDTLSTDLRWRNPEWYGELHSRARNYFIRRLNQTQGIEQQRVLYGYIFLHRENPFVRPFFEWQEGSGIWTDRLKPTDIPILMEMIAQYEGETAAQLALHWFQRQPQGVVVIRDNQQKLVGLLVAVTIQESLAAEIAVDPATQAAWRWLQSRRPLQHGDRATYFRFWLDAQNYQAVSPIQSRIFVNIVQHYLTTPNLAFTFISCAQPEFWLPMFAYANLERLPACDFTVDGRQYGVYGHDWRAEPPMIWLQLLAERETGAALPDEKPGMGVSSVVVMGQPEFAEAVLDALKRYPRSEALLGSPLLQSRLVMGKVPATASNSQRVNYLRHLIKEATDVLLVAPRQAKFYQVLYHTYLQPAPTQQLAADLLNLPFSTYRRYLKSGIELVTERLWQIEIGNLDG